ncbi:hypothetical protein N431DRAFT_500023 [Stipitochalara longipes BDJ]|nr:hypothetical protein N431DRAFT_500023 [Stipitochalara longipes BDJ]
MAVRFTSTIDLLALLSGKINNRNLLYNLCLTNRAFNAVFSRQLYRCLRWDDRNIFFLTDPDKLRFLVQSGNLVYTRVLIVLKSVLRARISGREEVFHEQGHDQRDSKTIIEFYSQLNRIIVDIVRQATGLKSFACQALAISSECMDALSKCSGLQTLAIEFPPDIKAFLNTRPEEEPRKEGNDDSKLSFQLPQLKLPAFSGLQRLSLHGLWGDIESWRVQVLQVILTSPHLKHFSLSISPEALSRNIDRRVSLGNKDCLEFFERLSTQYGEKKDQPLNLISIRLGHRISFPKMSAIAKSINLNALEEIHISTVEFRIVFNNLSDIFDSYFPPRLRILSFHQRGPKAWEFLPSLLDSARTSALGDELGITSGGINRLRPNLSKYKLCGVKIGNLPMIMFSLDKDRDSHETSVPQLPGPSLITSLAITAPDYLEHSNELPVNFPGFCESVGNLPALKALWIMRPFDMERGDQVPEKWHHAWDVQGCALAAEQISQASRSLRYIRIGMQAWRIWRKDADETTVSLETLDEWEDEVEGPDFFHVPFPLPLNCRIHHVDWRYLGY